MKRAINVAIWVACVSLAVSIFMLILLCAGMFGRSAYQIATKNGFEGTEQQWLDSLKGTCGKSAYELYVESLPQGETVLSEEEWLASLSGQRGATWFSGADEPNVEDSRQGDFYLRVFSDFADRRGYIIYQLLGDDWLIISDMSADVGTTEFSEYHIRTSSDFNAFIDAVSGEKANDFEGKTIYLDFDIEAQEDFVGIGSVEKPFNGTFDGRGHSATLRKGDMATQSATDTTGFFAQLGNKAKIVNFTVVQVTEAKVLPYATNWNNDGVTSNFYAVTDIETLMTLRDTVNSGNNYAKQTVKLTADIDMKGENWTPIGTSDNKFSGTFDGDNHTITNLVCDVAGDYAGLFGASSGATFQNLTIDGATLNGSGYIGALLGSSFPNGRIENVTARNVTATGNHYIGGVFGAGYVTIENCHAYNVTATATPNKIDGGAYDNGDKIGGIAGQVREYDTIHNCTVDGVTLSGYRDLGGVAGYVYSSPSTHSAKNVSITVDQTNFYEYKATNVGAIFGYTTKPEQSGTVENATYALDYVVATKSQEFVNLLNLANQIKPTKANIMLAQGTFEASANEQFRINVDNVTVNGMGENVTIVDAKGFMCSGQASFEVCGDNCTVSNLTITAQPENGNVAVLKVTEINNEQDVVNNFTLSHVTLNNTSSSNVGHGLNLHGVKGATVDYLNVVNYGKCGIAVAKATDVTITNTDLTDEDNTNWANIGFMYSGSSVNAYKTASDVTVDFASCTFGKNSSGKTLIYSERPTNSHDEKTDVIKDVTLGALAADNLPGNWKLDVAENGTWALTKTQSSSGSELQMN